MCSGGSNPLALDKANIHPGLEGTEAVIMPILEKYIF